MRYILSLIFAVFLFGCSEKEVDYKAKIRNDFFNSVIDGSYHRTYKHLKFDSGFVHAANTHTGNTGLMWAAEYGHYDIVQLLVLNGADVNATNNWNQTALAYAADWGNYDIAKFLIENGADVNITNTRGCSPLQRAVQYDYFDMIDLLIENGADINAKNRAGETPLMTAVLTGSIETVQILIQHGAIVNDVNNKGQDILTLADEKRNQKMLEFLTNLKQMYAGEW